jgi:hypothetical protein
MTRAHTHLRLTAIGVEDPHGVVRAIDTRHDKDDTIGTNAEIPVAQLHRLLRRHLRHGRIPIIHLSTQKSASRTANTAVKQHSGHQGLPEFVAAGHPQIDGAGCDS